MVWYAICKLFQLQTKPKPTHQQMQLVSSKNHDTHLFLCYTRSLQNGMNIKINPILSISKILVYDYQLLQSSRS